MIAAIYARKSTEQAGVADEQKSITRQIDHARAFAAQKGWAVTETCTFVDDGISGAEFDNRPGFLRLMNALKPQAPFQFLIMSEVSRLGREQIETAYALKQLSVAGVRCFSYLEDRELLMESATDKFLLGAVTFGADLEREKGRQRTYDAMARKARAGHVTGGRVFGYDNVEIASASGKRSHVERVINEPEAAIVRRIFELCAAGTGYTRIAKLLNSERAPAPRPQRARPAGWAPSSVNEILHRPLYRGEIVWNRTRKRNQWGQHDQQPRAAADWMHLAAPALRVVPDELWTAVHGRLAGIKAQLERASGGRLGVRARDIESRYLLPGFARCAVCGGGMGVVSRQHGGQRAFFYACTSYHKRGTSVCGNGLVVRAERVDEAVLKTLGGDVLRPAVVRAVLDGVAEAMKPGTADRGLDALSAEHETIERELARLSEAIAAGGQLGSLLDALKARQLRRDELVAQLAVRRRVDVGRFDRRTIEATARGHLTRWRSLLTKHTADGRQLLREVLAGPLRFTPEGKTYRFDGEAALGRLLAGIAGLPTLLASPTGFEPVF